MPNHVYSQIKIHSSKLPKVREIIANGGFARYYKPMPKELSGTASPTRIVSQVEYENQTDDMFGKGITQSMHDEYVEKFNYANWYEWCNANWNTKWGDYEIEINDWLDDESDIVAVNFVTAWSPLDTEIILMMDDDLDIQEYWWEEEQGFGVQYLKEDGEIRLSMEWDIPDWSGVSYEDEEGNYILHLLSDHATPYSDMEAGYYIEGTYDMPWEGDTKELKEIKTQF